MEIGLEKLIVGLIVLVPGFIASTAQGVFQPHRFESNFEWTASSLLRSILLNAVGIACVITFIDDVSSTPIGEVRGKLLDQSFGFWQKYVLALYAVAAIWGGIIGIWPDIALRSIANRLGLTTLGRHDSVWNRIFDKQRPEDRPSSWLLIHGGEGRPAIFGKLRHSSVWVAQDKPIEIYLNPIFEHRGALFERPGAGSSEEGADGLYMKLTRDHATEFYYREKNWAPSPDFLSQLAANAGAPAKGSDPATG